MNVEKKKAKLSLLPFILALCLTPLVVITKQYQTNLSKYDWFQLDEVKQIDSFEYYKGVLVIILGAILLVELGVYAYGQYQAKKSLIEERSKFVYILFGIYSVMVLISSILSQYWDLAFSGGGYNQWQNVWVLLGFVVISLYAYTFLKEEQNIITVLNFFMITLFIMAGIGTLQTLGNNPLNWGFVQKIMTSMSDVKGISFKEGISNVVVTFNNPDYSGAFVTFVLPVAIGCIFLHWSDNKAVNIAKKVFAVLIVAGLACTLYGAGTSTAILALGAGAFVAFVILSIHSIAAKNKVRMAIVGVIIVCGIVGFAVLLKSSMGQSMVTKLVEGEKDTRCLLGIETTGETELNIIFRNERELHVTAVMDEPKTAFIGIKTEENGTVVSAHYDVNKKNFVFDDEAFSGVEIHFVTFKIAEGAAPGFKVLDVANSIEWSFVYQNGELRYITPYGKMIRLRKVPRFGFLNHENFANRRGYIWSRTIPLMAEYWFKGIGPNAFIIAFPNDDFVGSKRVGGRTALVDKPHNMFLQQFIQTGGISAIAWLLLWGVYLVQSVRLFWKKKLDSNMEKIGFSIMIAMVCFGVVSIANDAVIGLQVVYWGLLGIGYAVLAIVKKQRI